MAAARRLPQSPWQWLTVTRLGISLLVIGLLAGAFGFRGQHGRWFDFQVALSDFYANISMELVSIAFTVLILDQMYRRRETYREKQQAVDLLGGSDPAMVQEALVQLRKERWLSDGSLNGVALKRAQLAGLDLTKASLVGADLHRAVLVGADLAEANLEGANLRGAELARTDLRLVTGLTEGQICRESFALSGPCGGDVGAGACGHPAHRTRDASSGTSKAVTGAYDTDDLVSS